MKRKTQRLALLAAFVATFAFALAACRTQSPAAPLVIQAWWSDMNQPAR